MEYIKEWDKDKKITHLGLRHYDYISKEYYELVFFYDKVRIIGMLRTEYDNTSIDVHNTIIIDPKNHDRSFNSLVDEFITMAKLPTSGYVAISNHNLS